MSKRRSPLCFERHLLRALAAAALGLVVFAAPLKADEPLAVIVHPSRDAELSFADLGRIYRRQKRFWSDGTAILPINREAGCAEREHFSQRVLGASSEQLSEYWNEQYYQGILPPVTLSSDAAVKRFVATDRNAIGYVHASEVDETVRVVLRLE